MIIITLKLRADSIPRLSASQKLRLPLPAHAFFRWQRQEPQNSLPQRLRVIWFHHKPNAKCFYSSTQIPCIARYYAPSICTRVSQDSALTLEGSCKGKHNRVGGDKVIAPPCLADESKFYRHRVPAMVLLQELIDRRSRRSEFKTGSGNHVANQ